MDDPKNRPLDAILELSIGTEISTIEFNKRLMEDDCPFHLNRVQGNDLEDLRAKLHRLVDHYMNGYIDFLNGN